MNAVWNGKPLVIPADDAELAASERAFADAARSRVDASLSANDASLSAFEATMHLVYRIAPRYAIALIDAVVAETGRVGSIWPSASHGGIARRALGQFRRRRRGGRPRARHRRDPLRGRSRAKRRVRRAHVRWTIRPSGPKRASRSAAERPSRDGTSRTTFSSPRSTTDVIRSMTRVVSPPKRSKS